MQPDFELSTQYINYDQEEQDLIKKLIMAQKAQGNL